MVVFRRKTSLVAAKVQIKNYINLNGENFELQSKYFSFGHEFGYEKNTINWLKWNTSAAGMKTLDEMENKHDLASWLGLGIPKPTNKRRASVSHKVKAGAMSYLVNHH